MRIIAILIILLPLSAYAGEPEWSLLLRKFSPWGKEKGVQIKSDGTVALAPGYKEEDIKVCLSHSLDESELHKFSTLIAGIPKEIPNRSILKFPTSCYDASENYLTVKAGSRERYFRYAQKSECQRGTEIPSWLSPIVEELWSKYEEIKDCETGD